nr:hypothetical protein AUSP0033_00025 [uncultured phage]
MEEITFFISIVAIIFGILQIILFFKLWGMTNNISKITNILESKLTNDLSHQKQSIDNSYTKDNPKIQGNSPNKSHNDINIGDNVIRLLDGKNMVVDSIENGKYFCKTSMIEGYKYFSRDEISPIKNS